MMLDKIKHFFFWREYRKFSEKIHQCHIEISHLNNKIDRLEHEKMVLKAKLSRIPEPKNAKERAKNWWADRKYGNKYP